MSSIFSEAIARAISDYRYLLRRYLPQAKRMHKLAELKLNDSTIYENEPELYRVARQIIADIEKNMDLTETGYYSYSGIAHFCNYLKDFMRNYDVDHGRVIHKAQKASKALIYVIQLFMKSENEFTPELTNEFMQCNKVIVENGSVEQQELYLSNLEKNTEAYPNFYHDILNDFTARQKEQQQQELQMQSPFNKSLTPEERLSDGDSGSVGNQVLRNPLKGAQG